MMENDEKRLRDSRQYWDQRAPAFDDEPDHGLRDPLVLAAWTGWLKTVLPEPRAAVLDLGCGTGSLSVVAARLGHAVTGVDVSPAMISLARAKAQKYGLAIAFQVMDAASPRFPPPQFDIVICRHLLWALPEPEQVLQRWAGLMRPGARLILIEGYWGTGAGLHAQEILSILPASLINVRVQNFSETPELWGGPVSDERYAVIADRAPR